MLSIIAGNGKHTMSFLLFIVNCAKLPQKQDMHLQGPGDFGSRAAVGLLQALVPALLMNICIVGMNQIFDVDIDKVNKPYLPLASGDWSLNTGIRVAVGCGVVAVLLGLYIGSPPLLATLVGSLLLGIAYSVDLPFLRWKKYPILAMGCILSVRYISGTCKQMLLMTLALFHTVYTVSLGAFCILVGMVPSAVDPSMWSCGSIAA